jgi:hypothetical protein
MLGIWTVLLTRLHSWQFLTSPLPLILTGKDAAQTRRQSAD